MKNPNHPATILCNLLSVSARSPSRAHLVRRLSHARLCQSSAMAARSAFRFTVARASIFGRLTNGAKLKSPRSPFGTPKKNPVSQSHRILRSPIEMSFGVESLLPYHSATASALLTSMLSVSRRSYGWTPEDCDDDV